MTDEDAIGSADQFGIVTVVGVWDVEYDLAQAQRESVAKYDIPYLQWESYRSTEITIGDNIPVTIAKAVCDELRLDVHGFTVDDHLLVAFDERFPDKEVYRKR